MNSRRIIRIMLFSISFNSFLLGKYEPHEIWWQEKLADQTMINTFQGWLGNSNAPSRILARNYIMNKQYRSILDVGCGLCIELDGYRNTNYNIEYLGLDITKRLVEMAQTRGINCSQGSIESIPLQNCIADVVYVRHLLEHLSFYEKAIEETIRCATKEVIVVFFMPPGEKNDLISYALCDGYYLYHNYYNKEKLEQFIKKIPAVKLIFWEKVNDNETILHIILGK